MAVHRSCCRPKSAYRSSSVFFFPFFFFLPLPFQLTLCDHADTSRGQRETQHSALPKLEHWCDADVHWTRASRAPRKVSYTYDLISLVSCLNHIVSLQCPQTLIVLTQRSEIGEADGQTDGHSYKNNTGGRIGKASAQVINPILSFSPPNVLMHNKSSDLFFYNYDIRAW